MINQMKQVFCPVKGKVMGANLTAKAEWRCVGCGGNHPLASKFQATSLEPASRGKKKFKKGGKPKNKGKGQGQGKGAAKA